MVKAVAGACACDTSRPEFGQSESQDMAKIDQFLKMLAENGGSDLHLTAGATPIMRLNGSMTPYNFRELTGREVQGLVFEIMTESQREEFEATMDLDFAYEIPEVARFRANVFMQRKGVGAVFRTIPTEVLSADQLGLPEVVRKFAMMSKGLVLVTGPTGSGKSTTLAAIIDLINETRRDHILTIEDPIEFTHPNKKCLVNQREVGRNTQSFARALRAALREDPDVIMIGEMRDLETIELAITAAETGHLVFGTLHTTSAPKTVDRIIDVFPTSQQSQIRSMLAESLKGVISQMLLKKKGGAGRVAALEILVATSALANLIRENKIFQIASIMQTGKKIGMQMLDQHILELLMSGEIEPMEAYTKSHTKANFEKYLKEPPPVLE
jgi:twitching motility protein PilT